MVVQTSPQLRANKREGLALRKYHQGSAQKEHVPFITGTDTLGKEHACIFILQTPISSKYFKTGPRQHDPLFSDA